MSWVVECLKLAAVGLALLPWYVLACIRLQNQFFGFSKITSRFETGKLGLAILFASMLAGMTGSYLLFCALTDALVRIVPKLTVSPDFGLATVTVWSFGVPLVVYAVKRHQFRCALQHKSPRCEQCGYVLRGLSVVQGRIRCPECGAEENARDLVNRFRHEKRVLEADRDPWST